MNQISSSSSSQQQRVLIVDDNIEAAEMLQMLLEMHGYVARVADSGTKGLTIHADFAPQVICTDLNMPGMSGYEFAQAVRAPSQPRPWIIAMSGESHSAARDIAAAGFDHSIVKPFSLDDILFSIRSMFERNA